MIYLSVRRGQFLTRPNRFIAHVELDGAPVVCHVKNTGRCRELLMPGYTVWLAEGNSPARKTQYDLIGVEKPTPRGLLPVNMDARPPTGSLGSGQQPEDWASSPPSCGQRPGSGTPGSTSTGRTARGAGASGRSRG